MKKYFPRRKKKNKFPLKDYAKYSGIAFKMGSIIFIGTFGGYKLDEYFGFEKHLITVVLSLMSVMLAIYVVVKDLIK